MSHIQCVSRFSSVMQLLVGRYFSSSQLRELTHPFVMVLDACHDVWHLLLSVHLA